MYSHNKYRMPTLSSSNKKKAKLYSNMCLDLSEKKTNERNPNKHFTKPWCLNN